MKKIHQDNLDEKFVSRRQGFDGRLLKVMVDTVTLPNGRQTTREIIAHPGAVCVVPVLDDGSIIFVKQYRYAVGSVLYEAAEWQKLTSIVTTPGFTDEVIHLYLARGLKKFDQHTDEDEFIDIEAVKPEEVRRMLLDGEIFDAKTLSALCMMQLVNKNFI